MEEFSISTPPPPAPLHPPLAVGDIVQMTNVAAVDKTVATKPKALTIFNFIDDKTNVSYNFLFPPNDGRSYPNSTDCLRSRGR